MAEQFGFDQGRAEGRQIDRMERPGEISRELPRLRIERDIARQANGPRDQFLAGARGPVIRVV